MDRVRKELMVKLRAAEKKMLAESWDRYLDTLDAELEQEIGTSRKAYRAAQENRGVLPKCPESRQNRTESDSIA